MRLKTVAKVAAVLFVAVVVTAVAVLLSLDFNQYRDRLAVLVQQSTGRQFEIAGDLDLKLLGGPALAVKDARLANAEWGSDPVMAQIGEFAAEVEVLPLLFGGNLRVTRLVLRDGQLLLETDKAGRGNWQFSAPGGGGGGGGESGGGGVPDFETVLLERFTLVYRDGSTGASQQVAVRRLEASAPPGRQLRLAGDLQLNGNDVAVEAVVGALSELQQPGKPYPVDLTLRAGDAIAKVRGTVAEPMTGKGLQLVVEAEGPDLGRLTAIAGIAVPLAKPFRLAANVSGAPEALDLTGLQAMLGATNLAGEASLALAGARPKLTATLASPLIDLAELLPPDEDEPPRERVFDDTALPLDALGALDADLDVTIVKLVAPGIVAENVKASLTLADRVLDVSSISADLAGGSLSGKAALSAQGPPSLSLDAVLTQLDVGRLLATPGKTPPLESKADAQVAVKGGGPSVRAIMAGLGGRAGLTLGQGKLNNTYTDLLAADLLQQVAPWAPNREDTRLNCMVARFDIREGKATSKGILLDTERVTIQGDGSIDLGAERLDLVLTPRPKDASLLSLAVPINVGGTFLAPSVAPDSVAIAKGVAGAVIGTAINPLGLLVPLVSGGSADKNPCVAALEGGAAGPAAGKGQPAAPADDSGVGGVLRGLGRSLGGSR